MSEIALIGKKIGMTREFYKSGQLVPVTVLKMEKARVIRFFIISPQLINLFERGRLPTPGPHCKCFISFYAPCAAQIGLFKQAMYNFQQIFLE